MWFTQDMVLFSQDHKEIFRATDAVNFNYNTVSPVLDVYTTNSLDLGNIPPGTYIYQAVMHDKLSNKQASYSFTINVVR